MVVAFYGNGGEAVRTSRPEICWLDWTVASDSLSLTMFTINPSPQINHYFFGDIREFINHLLHLSFPDTMTFFIFIFYNNKKNGLTE